MINTIKKHLFGCLIENPVKNDFYAGIVPSNGFYLKAVSRFKMVVYDMSKVKREDAICLTFASDRIS